MKQVVRFPSVAIGLVLCAGAATPASAEIVHLTSGRTVNVAAHRFEGDMVILKLRTGGEMSMPRTLVARVSADEVPWVAEQVEPATQTAIPVTSSVSTELDALIDAAASAHDVDADLVRAVIRVESGFRTRARSHKGAMGLMQLMPATARQYGVEDAYDPAQNIDAGVRHLRRLLDRYDVRLALAAYNAGEGTVDRYGGIPPYRETRNYVRKVLSAAGLD